METEQCCLKLVTNRIYFVFVDFSFDCQVSVNTTCLSYEVQPFHLMQARSLVKVYWNPVLLAVELTHSISLTKGKTLQLIFVINSEGFAWWWCNTVWIDCTLSIVWCYIICNILRTGCVVFRYNERNIRHWARYENPTNQIIFVSFKWYCVHYESVCTQL